MSTKSPNGNPSATRSPPERSASSKTSDLTAHRTPWFLLLGLIVALLTLEAAIMGAIFNGNTSTINALLSACRNDLNSCRAGANPQNISADRDRYVIGSTHPDALGKIQDGATQHGSEPIRFYGPPNSSTTWYFTSLPETALYCNIYEESLCDSMRTSTHSFVGTAYVWQSRARPVDPPSPFKRMLPYVIVRHITQDQLESAIDSQVHAQAASTAVAQRMRDAISRDPEGYVMQNELYFAMHMMPAIAGKLSITRLRKADAFVSVELRIELNGITVGGTHYETYYLTQQIIIIESARDILVATSSVPHASLADKSALLSDEWWSYFLVQID